MTCEDITYFNNLFCDVVSKYDPSCMDISSTTDMIDEIYDCIKKGKSGDNSFFQRFIFGGKDPVGLNRLAFVLAWIEKIGKVGSFIGLFKDKLYEKAYLEAGILAAEKAKDAFNAVLYLAENDFETVYGRKSKWGRIAIAASYISFLESQYDSLKDGVPYELPTKQLISAGIVKDMYHRNRDIAKLTEMGLIKKVSEDIPCFLPQQFILNTAKANEIRSIHPVG